MFDSLKYHPKDYRIVEGPNEEGVRVPYRIPPRLVNDVPEGDTWVLRGSDHIRHYYESDGKLRNRWWSLRRILNAEDMGKEGYEDPFEKPARAADQTG